MRGGGRIRRFDTFICRSVSHYASTAFQLMPNSLPSIRNAFRLLTRLCFLTLFSGGAAHCVAAAADPFETLELAYAQSVRPLVDQFCVDCHDEESFKGDLDLERFSALKQVRNEPKIWQEVRRQLVSGDMPPEKKKQPTAEERAILVDWTTQYLHAEALAQAGDPGPVVLRRLSNAEYTHTLRDLTGVASLDPAREFPVDGAAGEGFTNTGAALVMSPALFSKYFDAGKRVAEHAVLLPDGIVFSEKTSSADWAEEKLQAIRAFYARYTEMGDGIPVNLQGIKFNTRDAGLLPLEKYLRATIEHRAALEQGETTIDAVAAKQGLHAAYLGTLWESLHDAQPSLILDPIRTSWRESETAQTADLTRLIGAWQKSLWRFTTIGHIGKRDGPKAWQEAVNPIASRNEIKLKLPDADTTLYLVCSDAGDGSRNDLALWENPRIVYPDRPPLHLQDVQVLGDELEALRGAELKRTAAYLQALMDAHTSKQSIESLAEERKLHPGLLASWAALTRLGESERPEVKGHFTEKISNNQYPVLRGWGSHNTPSISANKSDQVLSVSTLTVPARSVIMHPSPDKEVMTYWRSPFDGTIQVTGRVADADTKCGNGFEWRVELITHAGPATIAGGVVDNSGEAEINPGSPFEIRKGDLVMVAVNPRDRNHICDTTHVALTIREVGDAERVWDLAKEVVDRIQDSNPLADSFGHIDTWHFCSSDEAPSASAAIPPGSSLATWRAQIMEGKPKGEVQGTALSVQAMLLSEATSGPDEQLRIDLRSWQGPLKWLGLSGGSSPERSANGNIEVQAPSILRFQLPKGLASGGELVAGTRLHPEKGAEGSVQMRVQLTEPDLVLKPGTLRPDGNKQKWSDGVQPLVSDTPFLVQDESATRKRLVAGFDAFRSLFPLALCYTKIVPVDEVVTLTLYYREDDHLQRLMLNASEAAELDQLWDGLRFVSHEPLKLVDAYEQLWQFATQDADPSAFTPMGDPIKARAEIFRDTLRTAEPHHVQAIHAWAERAWRRPLRSDERQEINSLYQNLRAEELSHDAAIRMCLARVLVAPEFLYKMEQPTPGKDASPVSDVQLAVRLSYFLWSTMPDAELMSLAVAGRLHEPDILAAMARRMLKDDRTKRLAVEFGCQWLGVRDFANLDEKSERHFPQFAALRGSMEEEAIRFFADFFQQDRSVLSLLDADHTFVDPVLATFYRMDAPNGWQRVEGLRARGRGGILGMAATLAKQSGASRTSPILRGNWVYETLLGEHLPNPPKDVPQLPDVVPEGLTERALIEIHSTAPACAKCHVKIDPYGFALENFDAIGQARGGRDTATRLPNGEEIEGLEGLRQYLLKDRREDFLRQFCRKLLGYALGRSVQLSDQPLIDELVTALPDHDYQIGFVIEQIVRSPQFRMIRGRDLASHEPEAEQP
ncbi:MAG: hypothetical protein ACI9QL_002039 [Candidatus Omnitrophota bacterium]|jgi:hypothetical protein